MYILLDSSIDRKISKLAPEEQGEVEEGDEDEDTSAKQEGVLLDLGDFVLNLADTNARRYIKVGVALELSKTKEEIEAENAPKAKSGGHGEEAPVSPDAAIVAEMERYKPAIRDAINLTLSNKTSDELSTSIGKEMAKDEIMEVVNGVFGNRRHVMRVSFSQFIIQ